MDIQTAEKVITDTEDQLLMGSIIADLGVATPNIIYRSSDILSNIGNELLSWIHIVAVWDIVRIAEMENIEARFGVDVNDEPVSIFSLCSHATLGENHTQHEGDLAEAVAVLRGLPPEHLRACLGRIVDRAGGLLIVHPDEFETSKDKGASLLARGIVQETEPETTFRFSGLMMHIGDPKHVHLSQIQVSRAGGHIAETGSNPFRYTHTFDLNPDYVPMEALRP